MNMYIFPRSILNLERSADAERSKPEQSFSIHQNVWTLIKAIKFFFARTQRERNGQPQTAVSGGKGRRESAAASVPAKDGRIECPEGEQKRKTDKKKVYLEVRAFEASTSV